MTVAALAAENICFSSPPRHAASALGRANPARPKRRQIVVDIQPFAAGIDHEMASAVAATVLRSRQRRKIAPAVLARLR
jgi:hypothetical protein